MSIQISNNIIKMNTAEDIAIVQEELIKLAQNIQKYKVDNSGEETTFKLDIEYELYEKFNAYNYQQELMDCESYAHAVEDKNVNEYMESLTGMKLIKPKKRNLRFANWVINLHEDLLSSAKKIVSFAHKVTEKVSVK